MFHCGPIPSVSLDLGAVSRKHNDKQHECLWFSSLLLHRLTKDGERKKGEAAGAERTPEERRRRRRRKERLGLFIEAGER